MLKGELTVWRGGDGVKRDILKFLSGVAAAFTFVHVAYAVATARGTISVPIWRGREWGIGKMLIEAVVYGTIGAGLGYLAWRPQRPLSLDRGAHQ
jgi:NhaP-type Na+/H+ or K+/H+ antiporter